MLFAWIEVKDSLKWTIFSSLFSDFVLFALQTCVHITILRGLLNNQPFKLDKIFYLDI